MKIIVKTENAGGIEAALAEANGRATAHTITSDRSVEVLAQLAEQHALDLGALKKGFKGARLIYVPAGPGEACAKKARSVVTTCVTLERAASAWALVDVEKVERSANSDAHRDLALTVQALNEIARSVYKGLRPLDLPAHDFGCRLAIWLKVAAMPHETAHQQMAILAALRG